MLKVSIGVIIGVIISVPHIKKIKENRGRK